MVLVRWPCAAANLPLILLLSDGMESTFVKTAFPHLSHTMAATSSGLERGVSSMPEVFVPFNVFMRSCFLYVCVAFFVLHT